MAKIEKLYSLSAEKLWKIKIKKIATG